MQLPLATIGLIASDPPSLATTLAWGCLAAGVILTLIGAWQRTVVMRLLANGRRTTAHAVASTLHHPEHHHGSVPLVWRFETEDGLLVEHEDLVAGLHKPVAGAEAKIIYDPADPHNARLETFAEGTLAWALFLTSGVVLLGVALVAGLYSLF